jgi:hypothetical protein
MEEAISIPWRERVEQTATRIIPFLVEKAPGVIKETRHRLNSPLRARQLANEDWIDEMARTSDQKKKVRMLRTCLDLVVNLSEDIKSQQISLQLQKVLSDAGLFTQLQIERSSGSLYPDLYFKDYDYSKLPLHTKKNKVEGPNRRKNGTPSNVPDGCELKTNEGHRIKVDAHAPHPGLHLALTWNFGQEGFIQVNGMWIAYLRKCDYTKGNANVVATTLKHSFGQGLFCSLLPPNDSGLL